MASGLARALAKRIPILGVTSPGSTRLAFVAVRPKPEAPFAEQNRTPVDRKNARRLAVRGTLEVGSRAVLLSARNSRPGVCSIHQDIRFCKAQDGVRLAYAVSGEGPLLAMSATWLTHLEHQWRSLAWRPWLEAFVHDHRLLRYDARGCGLSDRDAPDLSFENWVRDFARVIDAAAFDRFAILRPAGVGRLRSNMQRVTRSASAISFSTGPMLAGAFGGRTDQTSASAPACCSN